jgi:membrane protease YdiL (CAAX protease family)
MSGMSQDTTVTQHSWRQVWLFVALAYGSSWLVALLMFLLLRTTAIGLAAQGLAVVFMFGPALAAWVVTRRFEGRGRTRELLEIRFRPNRWWAVAWLLPLAISLVTLAVSLALPWLSFDPGMSALLERFRAQLPPEQFEQIRAQVDLLPVHPFFLTIAQGLLAGPTLNALAAFGEELGWRGFLFRKLAPLGFWRSSLLIGVLWGLWHAPLILQGHNYPQHPVLGVLWMTAFCVLLSPLMQWVRARAGSVLAAAVMHGSVNALFTLALMAVKGGDDLTMGATGLPGLLTLLAFNVGLSFVMRRGSNPPAA